MTVDEPSGQKNIKAAVHPEQKDRKCPDAPVEGGVFIDAVDINREQNREQHPDGCREKRSGKLPEVISSSRRHKCIKQGENKRSEKETDHLPRRCKGPDPASLRRDVPHEKFPYLAAENEIRKKQKQQHQDRGPEKGNQDQFI